MPLFFASAKSYVHVPVYASVTELHSPLRRFTNYFFISHFRCRSLMPQSETDRLANPAVSSG